MANRLANSTSPYLLAHAANPVDWWEWEEAAFEDEATAAYLNEHFVSIKIDREEPVGR